MEMHREESEWKQAWKRLDSRLAEQERHLDESLRLARARRRVAPLWIGLALMLAVGLFSGWFGGAAMVGSHGDPQKLIAGAALLVYGLSLVACTLVAWIQLVRIDPGDGVVEVQRRLLALRRWYLVLGAVGGLPWFVLWIAVLVSLVPPGTLGAGWLLANLALGGAGLLFTIALVRRAMETGADGRLAALLDSRAARRLERALEELTTAP